MKIRKETLWAFIFLMPNLTGVLVFVVGPVIAALVLGLFQWDMLNPPKFIALDNYKTLLLDDPLFWISIKNTIYFVTLAIPLGIVVALALAITMNQKIKGIVLFRTVYFLPVVCSMVAVALVWQWLYNPTFGLINFLLSYLHLPPQDWLGEEKLAMLSIVIMSIWKGAGYNMVILLAGLQGIPTHLYEAAKIDGANRWREFISITLPLLTPSLFFVMVINIIGAFQVFDQVYMMTEGGPGNATKVYNYYLYQNAFVNFRMGYACSMAYILFGIILLVTLVQVKFLGGRVQYGL